jgi:hypothetical protein
MKRARLAAAFAASLLFGSMSAAIAADDMSFDDSCLENARVTEERLLGSAGEAAQFAAYQVFTREIAATGVVTETFDAALADAGVPAAAMLEARQALATVIDLGHDMAAGDRFHVRYEQAFTAEGVPLGVGHVLWAELRTKAKGTVAIHRFRPSGGIERFWLANGEDAACDGVVVGAAPNGGYGNWIRIDHPGKLSTVYGHLSEFAPGIEAGVLVSRGELIGFVGNTGRSTGAHLHFEILSSGKAVDPLAYP